MTHAPDQAVLRDAVHRIHDEIEQGEFLKAVDAPFVVIPDLFDYTGEHVRDKFLQWFANNRLGYHTKMISDLELEIFRYLLRQRILEKRLLDENVPTEFEGEFNGSGDSGDYYVEFGDNYDDVRSFIMHMLSKHVQFDWYNNEGGGGDIKWNVYDNIVTINGYYNVMERVEEMVEEEF